MPIIYNKRIHVPPPGAVYVGRPSEWGNPFRVGEDGNREEVVMLFREHIKQCMKDPEFVERLERLRGRDLVCWCTPLPCHADILLEFANR